MGGGRLVVQWNGRTDGQMRKGDHVYGKTRECAQTNGGALPITLKFKATTED